MSRAINLEETGFSLLEGHFYNHDYLWFSSAEVAKVSSTCPTIHNYALSYSLSQFSHGVYKGNSPAYEEDLTSMPFYTTPAMSASATRTAMTLNALDDLTLRTDRGGKINSPNLGKRLVLEPCFEGSLDGSRLKGGYSFFCFAKRGFSLPAVTRLGKKGCAIRFRWRRFMKPKAFYCEDVVIPTHAVNPLDVSGEVLSYEPVVLPPHMLFRRVEIKNDWFIKADGQVVLLPKRILQNIS
jgi:CRISPR type I-D-associated protein Csc1